MKRHRSVLSRLERVKILHERGTLDPEESSVLGLPKVRHLKIRIKKEKAAAPAPGTPEALGTPAKGGVAATATPASGGKAAAGPKPAAGLKAAQKGASAVPKPEGGVPPKKKE